MAILEALEKNPPSGSNERDIKQNALSKYQDIHKRRFTVHSSVVQVFKSFSRDATAVAAASMESDILSESVEAPVNRAGVKKRKRAEASLPSGNRGDTAKALVQASEALNRGLKAGFRELANALQLQALASFGSSTSVDLTSAAQAIAAKVALDMRLQMEELDPSNTNNNNSNDDASVP